jgi:hypothetical protein
MPGPEEERRLAPRRKPVSGPVEDYQPGDDDIDPDGPSRADLERFGDVTMKCPECGTELFDDVAVCWKCGRPVGPGAPAQGKQSPWVLIAIIITVLAVLLTFNFF